MLILFFGFIDFILKRKSLTDFTDFSLNNFKKNDNMISKRMINPKVLKTKNGKTMLLSKCTMCSSKKSRLIKEQEARRTLGSLGLKTPLNNISLLDDILFWMQFHWFYKMNDIVNKLLLGGDKFMPEMHSKQPATLGKPGFTYSACETRKSLKV